MPSREPRVRSCAPAACFGEFAVEEHRGGPIRGLRFRLGCERTKVDFLPVHSDSRSPFGAAERDSFDPGFAAACPMPHVFLRRGISQVFDAIIRRLFVFVIDVSGRMLAMNIEPGKPMGRATLTIDLNPAIPVFIAAPRPSLANRSGRFAASNGPAVAAAPRLVRIPCCVPHTQCA